MTPTGVDVGSLQPFLRPRTCHVRRDANRGIPRISHRLATRFLIVATALWWLLGTGAGLRFALARAESITDGALDVQQAKGRLIGPLDLACVRYDDGNGTVATVAKAHLDLRFWPLLARRVHVIALDVEGVEVALPKPTGDDTASAGGFSPRK